MARSAPQKARTRPRVTIRRVMRTRKVKPPMTDKLWGIHRILANRIHQLYMNWENAAEEQKHKAEERLVKALATRSKYGKAPRA